MLLDAGAEGVVVVPGVPLGFVVVASSVEALVDTGFAESSFAESSFAFVEELLRP